MLDNSAHRCLSKCVLRSGLPARDVFDDEAVAESLVRAMDASIRGSRDPVLEATQLFRNQDVDR